MAQHTPGPWIYDDNTAHADVYDVYGKRPDGEYDPKTAEAYFEANARLIAAAPDMLKALNDLLSHLWDGRKRDVKKDYSLMVAEVAARNAVDRAEGGCHEPN